MKKTNPVKVLLLAAAIVLALVCLTGCSDNSALEAMTKQKDELLAQVDTLKADAAKAAEDAKAQLDALTGEKDELAKQVETLTADAAKAAEEAQGQLDALTGEKDELAKKVETLTADAAKAAEEAKATLESEVAKVKEEAQGTIDGLKGQIEELTKSLDFGNLDEEGIKGVFEKLKTNPKIMNVIPDILKEFGIDLAPAAEAAE